MTSLLLLLAMSQEPEPLSYDRQAVIEQYEERSPNPWGIKDWDHES